jgi:hypothetical protein
MTQAGRPLVARTTRRALRLGPNRLTGVRNVATTERDGIGVVAVDDRQFSVRKRRGNGEPGTPLVESAIITPVLLLFIFGIFEFGFAFRDYLGVANIVRDAAREASVSGNASDADYRILRAVERASAAVPEGAIDQLIVFEASGPESTPPASCLAGNPRRRVYANKRMPVRTDPPAGATANFYLAEIAPQHQGKTLVVSLWDPGEGMEWMEILDPAGGAVPFTYETAYKVKGSTVGLSVSGAVWDGQLVEIRVDLSLLPWGTYSTDWFKVRYAMGGGTSADWTTWGVDVIGDPVRLLE